MVGGWVLRNVEMVVVGKGCLQYMLVHPPGHSTGGTSSESTPHASHCRDQ